MVHCHRFYEPSLSTICCSCISVVVFVCLLNVDIVNANNFILTSTRPSTYTMDEEVKTGAKTVKDQSESLASAVPPTNAPCSNDDIPYLRNSLARAVYMKMKEDENNRNDRHVYWYRVIVSRVSPALQEKFIQFEQDEGTEEFLSHCIDLSDELFTQLFHSVARTVLKLFMTQTAINGLLHRGSMFVFSHHQVERLLGISAYHKRDNLLDLGAGDGKVTKVLAKYYQNTYVTEMSSVMGRRLQAYGFSVLGVDDWQRSDHRYDLISCLNLLDRCDKPMTLLADIRASLAPGGRLLLAVVIPYKPYVEFESTSHQPSELLRVKGASFEEEVEQFSRLFNQAGFSVESWTRLPYLCEGDLRHSYFVLTDAVFVLVPKPAS